MIILDIETTGLMPSQHQITEIGALKVIDGAISETFSQLINPRVDIPPKITEITGIDNQMVQNQPTIDTVMRDFVDFCGKDYIVGHNVSFDYSFLKTNAQRLGLSFEKKGLDTLQIAKFLYPELASRSLTSLCQTLELDRENAHRAYDDAYATYQLLVHLKNHPRASVNQKLFEPKPLYYKIKKDSPITNRQLKFLQDLCLRHGITLEKPIGSYTKSEASRQIDQILSSFGRFN